MVTPAQIQALIDAFPTGEKDGVSAQMIIDVLQALKDRNLFSGSYPDLTNVPDTLYHTNEHLAKVKTVDNTYVITPADSGFIIYVSNTSAVNVLARTSEFPEGFECILWQHRTGFINLIDVDQANNGGTATFELPPDKISETEFKSDIIYLVKVDGVMQLKGNLKSV